MGSTDGRIQLVSILASSGLLLLVLEMVRRRKLMERFALLWLLTAIVLLIFAIFGDLLGEVSRLIGVATPSNALFLIAFGMVTVVLINFSASISRLADQNKVLAQKLAASEERLRQVEGGARTNAVADTQVGAAPETERSEPAAPTAESSSPVSRE